MQVICETIKNGKCCGKYIPPKTCKHQKPHEKSITCIKSYCIKAGSKVSCVIFTPTFNFELPEDVFE